MHYINLTSKECILVFNVGITNLLISTEGQDVFAAIAFSNVQLMFRFSLACIM